MKQFPIIPCNLCGSQPNLQRQVIGDMLRDWDKRFPGRIESMFSALQTSSLPTLPIPNSLTLPDWNAVKI
ncbi:C32 tRNA thiolase [Neisseria gonorrhoeae]|uniref:C32 tRNA thiolase n=1 Tax=Neisseria gonorrhoeae TaxID=485 RepID=A0A378VY23_NEIGO|nr:C32 tRNA thiolase [Neisseria gonorrhoeae]